MGRAAPSGGRGGPGCNLEPNRDNRPVGKSRGTREPSYAAGRYTPDSRDSGSGTGKR